MSSASVNCVAPGATVVSSVVASTVASSSAVHVGWSLSWTCCSCNVIECVSLIDDWSGVGSLYSEIDDDSGDSVCSPLWSSCETGGHNEHSKMSVSKSLYESVMLSVTACLLSDNSEYEISLLLVCKHVVCVCEGVDCSVGTSCVTSEV